MLKELIEETAAGGAAGVTSAGAVAGFREPLGSKSKKKGKKKSKMRRRGPVGLPYSFHLVGEGKGAGFGRFLAEMDDSDFDRSDVIAKLKTAAKAAEEKGSDTAGFALEDENGSMVKVWVPEDQADNFAQALQAALAGADEDEDDENSSVEIAEVLWKLRKQFDIINVEWGEIPEDEEEPVQPAGAEGAELGGEGGELGGEGEGEPEDMTADADELGELNAEEPGAGEEAAASALTKVIDMMKADAEARKAEAEARAAEASARAAAEKVKQEEEVLDMEAYYDQKKESKKEAQQLAKLAKYKHDLANDKGAGLDSVGDMAAEPEMEEVRGRNDTSITKGELGDMLLKALRR